MLQQAADTIFTSLTELIFEKWSEDTGLSWQGKGSGMGMTAVSRRFTC